MIRRYAPMVFALLATTALGACAQLNKGKITNPSFWESSPFLGSNEDAELGLAELAKGHYGVAEAYFNKAVARDDRDVIALMGLGLLYQNTGQTIKARQAYESLLAIRPVPTEQMMVMGDLTPRPIAEQASANLARLQSGTPLPAFNASGGGVSGAPYGTPMMGRVSVTPLKDSDQAVVSRFEILRTLRDQGLITPEEYDVRRQANIGALLPLSSPPPAEGLERPVPDSAQIVGRLQAIGRALEMRAITISQHTAERTMILDALLPEKPPVLADPARPPANTADGVRRLERLQTAGLITPDEYTRERSAIERARPTASRISSRPTAPPPASATSSAPSAPSSPRPAAAATGGQRAAVHLASYKSREQANQGWAELRRTYQGQLGNLQPEVTSVNLGEGKGTFFRLKAGPLASAAAAKSLCDDLKRQRQYCEPSQLGGS